MKMRVGFLAGRKDEVVLLSVVVVYYSLFYWIAQNSETPACLSSSSTNLLAC